MKKALVIIALASISACGSAKQTVTVKFENKVIKKKDWTNTIKTTTELIDFNTKSCKKIYKQTQENCELKITQLYSDVLKRHLIEGTQIEKLKWLKDNLVLGSEINLFNTATPLLYDAAKIKFQYHWIKDESATPHDVEATLRFVFNPELGFENPNAIQIFKKK